MSNCKTKPLDLSINLFSIAAQLKTSANNSDDEVSTTSEEENNSRQLKVHRGEGLLNKYMFCLWCKEAGKNNNFTEGFTLYSSFAVQARTDQIKIMRNMCNIYFLIQHNLSTNIFEDLYKLSEIQRAENQNQFECGTEILNIFNNDFSADDERAPYSSYQNNVSACEFIESIGRVIEQEIFQKLRNSDGWSIMIDENNTISTEKNLFILEHHCISHKLALATKDAAKQVEEFKLYEKIVHSIYSYFSRSVEYMMHLKMKEENISDPQLIVLNIIKTCWLSLSNRIHLRKYIINNEISLTELPVIITKFVCATVELLEKRFPNRIQIDIFHIFDLMALPVNNSDFQKYGEDEIEILGNFYSQDKFVSGNLFSARLNSKNLKHEWLSVRYLLTNYKNLNFLEAWKYIFLDLSTFNEIYLETAKLISILINLPLTNAVVE
ncbi:11205_t:CDS:2 [Scutellospora calospora]|uniref:11205_t:CDS:1 n=1 Tax=Scutellospora calospora TaxID=85575 RepID=A0ACA9K451_9GLOM|nr:11205_t:CDS:2 [Scutellospora calospora]